MSFTEGYVFRLAFVSRNVEFDEEDCYDSHNVHYLISINSGSFTVVFLNKYIKELQVSASAPRLGKI